MNEIYIGALNLSPYIDEFQVLLPAFLDRGIDSLLRLSGSIPIEIAKAIIDPGLPLRPIYIYWNEKMHLFPIPQGASWHTTESFTDHLLFFQRIRADKSTLIELYLYFKEPA